MTSPLISTESLAARLGTPDLVVFDATKYLPNEGRDGAAEFARAHIPGARFLLPAFMSPLAAPVAQGRTLVFTSPDGAAARIAAADALREWPTSAKAFWLEGGRILHAAGDRGVVDEVEPASLQAIRRGFVRLRPRAGLPHSS